MDGLQAKIARDTGFSAAYVSQIFTGARRVTKWATAVKLASATNTRPTVWLEGTVSEIKKAVTDAAFR